MGQGTQQLGVHTGVRGTTFLASGRPCFRQHSCGTALELASHRRSAHTSLWVVYQFGNIET